MKTKSIIVVLAAAFTFSSCSKFVEDYDVSPNSPIAVNAALLTTNAEVALFATYGGQLARTTAIWSQQLAGTDAQMLDHEAYRVFEGDIQNEWDVIYADGIETCRDLIDNYSAGNPYYMGIGQVLQAMYLGIATDLWDDVPNSEAGKSIENLNPKFDSQESVIKSIQSLLTAAVGNFAQPATANSLLPGADDLIYGGDAAMWTKTAHMLQARYALRLSARGGSMADVLSALTNAGLTGSGDDMNAAFGSAGTELNTWFAFETARPGYLKMNAKLVDMLKANSDPRLSFYAGLDTGGIYRGSPTGAGDISASPIGSYLQGTSLPLVSYVEARFNEAEAKFGSDKLGAATAFNDAVKASVLQVTGASDAAFESAVASETAVSLTLDKIHTQKYVALFGQVEAYNNWRRTNVPALTANPDGVVSSIPLRMPTPLEERLYNQNAKVVSDITKAVWWDN